MPAMFSDFLIGRRLVAATLMICALGAAAPAAPPELSGLRERWTESMQTFGVPGFAVVVVRGDEVIYLDTFGHRDPERSKPVTPDTMYYIASVTKTYTTAGILALVEDGKLRLDDPVRKYLPRLELPDEGLAARLTVRDLLCHRHGINSGPIVLLDAYTGEITEDRYYAHLKHAQVSGATEYTNVHFTLAGRVIEAVSGQEWRAFLRDRIFTPAGMPRTTGYADEMYADADVAIPMSLRGGEWGPATLRKSNRTMHAAGGLGTSIRDLGTWLRLQLNDGRIGGKQVLTPSSVAEMHASQSETAPDGSIRRWTGFGLGWRAGTFRGRPFRGHGGGYEGAAAFAYFLPEERIGVGVLTNASGPAAGFIDAIVTIDIFDRLLGLQEKDLMDAYRPRAEAWMKQNAAAAAPAETPALLSLAPSAYAGRYVSDGFGTVFVETSGAGLRFRIGEMALDFAPAGTDKFSDGDEWSGAFSVSDARVTGITLQTPHGPVEFTR